jgi:hypothetical protein
MSEEITTVMPKVGNESARRKFIRKRRINKLLRILGIT